MDDDPANDARTAAIYNLTLHHMSAERDWWKMKYRVLTKVLSHQGVEVIEDAHGNIDIGAMRAGGHLPPRQH